ncbi:MAG: hypothetical protein H0U74_14390 [Bradymonadaceae bacterium]|nr:hypothetical protein [Lujinxingiaceae bacterium]
MKQTSAKMLMVRRFAAVALTLSLVGALGCGDDETKGPGQVTQDTGNNTENDVGGGDDTPGGGDDTPGGGDDTPGGGDDTPGGGDDTTQGGDDTSDPSDTENDVEPGADADPDVASEDTSPDPISFSTVYSTVIAVTCTGCHTAGHQLAMATEEAAFTNLVGVNVVWANGNCATSSKRVDPANAANSFLWRKIAPNTTTCGQKMPQGATALSQAKVDLVEAWIAGGALR